MYTVWGVRKRSTKDKTAEEKKKKERKKERKRETADEQCWFSGKAKW